MSWCAVDVRSPPEERDAVARWLVGKTGQAVEEKADGTLVGFAEGEQQAGTLLEQLRSEFGRRIGGSTRALPEIDWRLRWKDGLGARKIGRLTITPSWFPPVHDTLTIIIDPETAFGTGEHGSTRIALLLLDRYCTPESRVLDLGSGSGILAIAAAKLGAARAIGIDNDPETEPIAKANAERNGVSDRVSFISGDAGMLAPLLGPAELVLSNILRAQNEALLPAIAAALTPGGLAIFAGMEQTEREEFLSALARAEWSSLDEAEDESWWGVAARPV